MARGDGINRTSVRNARMADTDVSNMQAHNEREKESYVNQDIVQECTSMNVHFKKPEAGYREMFDRMVADGSISTRGLKTDAVKFGELIFDVNSAYFYNHGGYEYAKQFYEEAYRSAVEIVGGEQYILSAVMHADERNRAMSDALGEDVYHYHLHVVYVPVVEKQILWTKRCKDKSLVGTVKETIHQVSMSKKWESKAALDEQGKSILSTKGKPVLRKSYSVLQDDFFRHMKAAGYDDIERGERGSSEEHLTVTQFKVQKEQDRLAELTQESQQKEQLVAKLDRKMEKLENQKTELQDISKIEAEVKSIPFTSRVSVERSVFEKLAAMAKRLVIHEKKESKLQRALDAANAQIRRLTDEVSALKKELLSYKSVQGQLHRIDLERENAGLRRKLEEYEETISRNGMEALFNRSQQKSYLKER